MLFRSDLVTGAVILLFAWLGSRYGLYMATVWGLQALASVVAAFALMDSVDGWLVWAGMTNEFGEIWRQTIAFVGSLLVVAIGIRLAIGASIGGTVAMRYAADHPDRIERLGLISPGSLEKRVRGRSTPAKVPKAFDLITLVTPRALPRFMLTNDYGDPARVSDAVVDEWWSMWMREGNRAAMLGLLRQYVSGGVEDKIRAVRAPVLLIWGERNKRVPLALAYETRDLLVNSPEVRLEVLPGIGHMLVQEAPQESARIVAAWLDGPVPAATPAAAPGAVRTAAAASL